MFGLETGLGVLLLLCLVSASVFEFVNGFHDTANAVATVIYTKSLKPYQAVLWSGFCNLLGVIFGGVGVAMGIVKLLPLADISTVGVHEGAALVLGMIVSAIIWNLGTWYFGIPCSSSHTMIGSTIGAGLMFNFLHPGGDGVNWTKATEIGASLLISPLFGFASAIVLMYIGRQLMQNDRSKRSEIFKEPPPGSVPPTWIRVLLFLTCTAVSFFHGSNDGQKGVGLVLIILMTFFPLQYALNSNFNIDETKKSLATIEQVANVEHLDNITDEIEKAKTAFNSFTPSASATTLFTIRKAISKLSTGISEELKIGEHFKDSGMKHSLKVEADKLKKNIEFAPFWVILMISLSLGIGTTIGWKRIVVTIGEKIGKRHMTYAEGAAAEIIAASTIGLSTGLGLPVSTTHVLSSGVAGAMTASKGVKNLQPQTIKNIGLAWLLTLPVCIILSGGLYWLLRFVV